MPQVTVYIRKDDLPIWEALKKKSEFMHKCLELYKQKYPSKVSKEPVYTNMEEIA